MKAFFLILLILISNNLSSLEISSNPFETNKNTSFSNDSFVKKDKVLSSKEAFSLSFDKREDYFTVFFDIQPKHYLYAEQLKIKVNNKDYKDFHISNSVEKNDGYYGETKVVYDNLFLKINVKDVYKIEITYQGCSEEFNICYPKEKYVFNQNKEKEQNKIENEKEFFENFNLESLLKNNSIYYNIFIFFLGGILVSLTPCILPMIPIISSIIINQKGITTKKALRLSSYYVLGSSFAYSLIGIIAAVSTKNIQSYVQSDFFIITSSLILLALSFSMIGLFNIQSPNKFNNKINEKISLIKLDSFINIFIVGFLSTLIISPCVAVPLAAAVLYISTTGDVITGGINLFSFGLGVGVILIIVSTSLNKIKLNSGKIVVEVKYLISFILAIASVFILERVFSEQYTNLAYIIVLFIYLMGLNKRIDNRKILIFSTIIITFFYFMILDFSYDSKLNKGELINNINELNDIKEDRYYLKFTADWCTYCKKLDKETLNDKNFLLKEYKEYVIDLTDISEQESVIMKKFNVIAPPVLIFFDEKELIVKETGFIEAKKLIEKIEK